MKVYKFTFTSDGPTLSKYISALESITKHVGDNIHTTLVGVTVHAIEHGDCTLINKLDAAVSNAFHKSGMRTWAIAKGPFAWDKGDKVAGRKAGFAFDRTIANNLAGMLKADRDTYIAGLMSKTFWDFAPQKEFEGFNFKAKLAALIAQAKKVMTDDKKSQHQANSFAGVSQAEALLTTIKDKPTPATPVTQAAPFKKAKKAKTQAQVAPTILDPGAIGPPAPATVLN